MLREPTHAARTLGATLLIGTMVLAAIFELICSGNIDSTVLGGMVFVEYVLVMNITKQIDEQFPSLNCLYLFGVEGYRCLCGNCRANVLEKRSGRHCSCEWRHICGSYKRFNIQRSFTCLYCAGIK